MTFTAFTICSNKDQADSLADALEKTVPAPFGVGVFEVEDGSNTYEIGSYFLEKPSDIDLLLLSSAFHAKSFVISEVPETDWVAHVKRELPPVEAGRFCVLGSHDIGKASTRKVNLIIDAAMAFGTVVVSISSRSNPSVGTDFTSFGCMPQLAGPQTIPHLTVSTCFVG